MDRKDFYDLTKDFELSVHQRILQQIWHFQFPQKNFSRKTVFNIDNNIKYFFSSKSAY